MVRCARAEPPPLVFVWVYDNVDSIFVRVDDNADNFGQLFLTGPLLPLCAEAEKIVLQKIAERASPRLPHSHFNKN